MSLTLDFECLEDKDSICFISSSPDTFKDSDFLCKGDSDFKGSISEYAVHSKTSGQSMAISQFLHFTYSFSPQSDLIFLAF